MENKKNDIGDDIKGKAAKDALPKREPPKVKKDFDLEKLEENMKRKKIKKTYSPKYGWVEV